MGLDAAALTTIGAIAVQGLRQSQVVFGENVVVIGAGLVGVLTVQLAKAAGCRVVAIDIDPNRVQRAVSMGADLGLLSEDGHTPSKVKELTQFGADVAILTAATPSTAPIELAARVLRDRGRIVVVGDVGLGVSRSAAYQKELSVTLSRSYGPGRYDPQYEQGGVDYPIGYVRWTEKRNMEAFLSLLASGAVNVAPLIERRHGVHDGARAYSELKETGAYTVLIEYPVAPQKQTALFARTKSRSTSSDHKQSEGRLHWSWELCAQCDLPGNQELQRRNTALRCYRIGCCRRVGTSIFRI